MKKDNNSIKLKQLFDLLDEIRLKCPNCDSKREEVELWNMSKDLREEFKKKVEIFGIKENATLFYCRKCNKFRILTPFKPGSKI